MKFVTAAMSGVLIYVAIPVSYLLDFLFFGKQFGAEELCGVTLIVLTNVTLGFLKGRGIISWVNPIKLQIQIYYFKLFKFMLK